MRNLAILCVLLALAAPAAGQSSPFLPDPVYRVLANEVSGDISYEHVRWFTHWHRPTAGSEGFEAVARYIEQKAKDYGLEDVRRIHVKSDGLAWKVTSAELRVVAPFERRLAYSPEVQLSVADGSRAADIKSAELADIGDGAGYDYAAKPVTGKVVLTSGSIAAAMNEAVWAHGALGVIAISTARATDYPDQLSWMRVPEQSADGTKKGTFSFVLSPREGQRLRREIAASKTPLTVSVKIDAGFSEAPFQSFVEAVIRGTEIHDQDIVLTGHIQEERFSANDDGSGLANVLEIGRALKKAIDEGRLPRPRRDIRFWWCDEIGGEEQFFALYPDERKQILANINQDMVGALQSAGSRVQFVTREPWSRASFLGDVVESIIVALVAGNTGYLSPGQVPAAGFAADGMPEPGLSYTRPILAPLGTRERYDARVIPFHNNTDSQVFNMGVVGIPAVTFTNWPDDFIHSTGDDLWQVDATQLERNAVAIAGMSWFLATAGDAQVPLLATHMYGRALERMSRDARLAMEFVEGALPAGSDLATGPARLRFAEAHDRAARLVREAARRERRAIESVRTLVSKGGAGAVLLDRLLAQLPTDSDAAKRLDAYALALAQAQAGPKTILPSVRGGIARPAGAPPPLADQVPSPTSSVKTFLELRGKLERPRTLHPLMQYEALNFADGKRTVREIFEAVAAEADAAGAWYYGTVQQADVEKLFESAAKIGMVSLGAAALPVEAPRVR
jgi:Zn-dependent M28 family amino/carboxypeptidase